MSVSAEGIREGKPTVDAGAALAAIEVAIQNEIAGQRFYEEASRHCIDVWAKDVFALLARDEEKHTQLLLGEHEALATGGEWLLPEDALAAGQHVDITRIAFSTTGPESALFPPEWTIGERINRTWDDLNALAFGLSLERAAIALYQGRADATTDPAAVRAFQFLVAEEQRHYRALVARWEELAGVGFES